MSRKPGRPTDYTEELGQEICRRLAKGDSLRKICRLSTMPDRGTVMEWVLSGKHPEFTRQYARARELQAENLADEIIDEADRAKDRDSAAAAKVRVDARKWVASKLLPKKYGDRTQLEHSGPDGKPLFAGFEVVIHPARPAPADGDD